MARAGAAHVDGTEQDGAANPLVGGEEQGAGQVLSFRSGGPPFELAFAAPHPWARRAEHVVQRHDAPGFAQPPPGAFSSWSWDRVHMALAAGEPFSGRAVGCGGVRDVLPGDVAPAMAEAKVSCLPLAREVGCRAAAAAGGGQGRNFIVSPLSFHAALALVADGARGKTQRELLGFLGSPSLAELHRSATTRLVARLRHLPQTSFACGVWVDRGHALTPEFMDAASSRYAAVAEPADFATQPEQARERVNAFVSDATKGLIRDVLPPNSVRSSTVVVLANAVYFKGRWSLPFHPWATFHAPFHPLDGGAVRAPFMTTDIPFERHVAAFPGFTALKLPYKNDGDGVPQAAFYMLLLLPDSNGALKLADLYDMAVTTPEFIKKHTPAAKSPVRRLMVPKFKFSFKFEAKSDMQKLGVTQAFLGGDFAGMVTGGDGLVIAGVYHQATIEVDELGTVAAASTAVAMMQQGGRSRPPVDFVADRPFLFAVVEELTGAVLFLGHVVNPLAE
uniref:Serpin domain-containing protein n=1 Tax=Oryza punctata TaxID=4537 RepID=A0A0E0JGT8_ORYPU